MVGKQIDENENGSRIWKNINLMEFQDNLKIMFMASFSMKFIDSIHDAPILLNS